MTSTLDFRSCMAAIASADVSRLSAVLILIGSKPPIVLADVDVSSIGALEPDLLLLDIDELETDPLEAVRMMRFLLRSSVIAVYTGRLNRSWGLQCHLAGASCVLSKLASDDRTAFGLTHAMQSGCFTDPAFAAA
ncbi:MAG TPA: hypothetical protein VGX96_20915 [Candidatus Elarobacter sp.]|jgi:DNA-binding NarL/FixJ family response regulator|nr:hypothetical protein [Candidatus Elarobacter sp.]